MEHENLERFFGGSGRSHCRGDCIWEIATSSEVATWWIVKQKLDNSIQDTSLHDISGKTWVFG